jgi:protocatechuate 3,4-dioxygenase beta subunit
MIEHPHDDDAPIGRILTRREAVVLLGGAGAVGFLSLAGCTSGSQGNSAIAATTDNSGSTATCAAKPEMTEGPYFVDEKLNRADIRSDASSGAVKPGALLTLTFNVSRIQAGACTPLPNAQVDLWHCDAAGVYSDAADPSFNTRGQNWLRGYQLTNADGVAKFSTILPGWYRGRATHIHFKIRGKNSSGSPFDFTSQLFFGEPFLASAYNLPPYDSRSDSGRTRNARDGIYNRGGSELLVTPASANGAYSASFNIGLDV